MHPKQMIKAILSVLAIIGLTGSVNAQCTAGFSASTNAQAGALYTNTSSMASTAGLHFYWTFTGGNPGSAFTTAISDSVYVAYPGPGTYTACLVAADSINNCADSICDTVVITTYPLLIGNVNAIDASCGQCNGSITTWPSGGLAPYSFLWSNASTSNSITGLCAGLYTCTITDNNGTTEVVSSNIQASGAVTATPGTIAYVCDSANQVCASATGGAVPYSYVWSNGDSSNCIYVDALNAGTYSVTITDANGCTDSTTVLVSAPSAISLSFSTTDATCPTCCDGSATAVVSGGTGGGFAYNWLPSGTTTASLNGLCTGGHYLVVTDNVSGCTIADYAFIGNPCQNSIYGRILPLEPATVYLIQESGGVLSLVDSANVDPIDSNYYSFDTVCNGTYYVKAALRPSSLQYGNYIPTYYTSEALWANATSITVNAGGGSSAYITMIQGTNPGGPGFVGGLISQGANRAEGDPVAGATVILFDNDDQALDYTISDENGAYSFDNVAIGEYKVLVDLLNFQSFHHSVSVTEGEVTFDEKNFVVEAGTVRPVEEEDNSVGIGSADESSDVRFFPNPVNDVLTITGEGLMSVTIYNVVGQQVITTTLSNQSQAELDMQELAPGQYILKIETASSNSSHRFVKN